MMTADISRLQRVCKKLVEVTKKEEAPEITRTARDVGYRAMSFTGFTTAAQLDRDLKRDGNGNAAAASWLRRTGVKITKESFANALVKIRAFRVRSLKVRRVGWIKGILDLGGTIKGAAGGVLLPNGIAAEGAGEPASLFKLISKISNAVYGEQEGVNAANSKEQMRDGLQKAIRFVTKDRLKYIRRKMEKMLNRASD